MKNKGRMGSIYIKSNNLDDVQNKRIILIAKK
jgi:hypothetical protein